MITTETEPLWKKGETDLLKGLQEWYTSHCNGDWEHTYGISLSTLDNPGWSLKIDLTDTCLSDRTFDEVHFQGADQNDWYVCKIESGTFLAASGPNRLCDRITVFLEWVLGTSNGDRKGIE